jgi:hypothetical protein
MPPRGQPPKGFPVWEERFVEGIGIVNFTRIEKT